MKTASIDSSSAIILYRANFFEEAASCLRLIYAESVIREITVPERPGSERFSLIRHLYPGDIYDVGLAEPGESFSLSWEGERDTINLYLSGYADYVITDDKKGASFCRKRNIPHINALLLPGVLFFSGRIPAEKRKKAESLILHIGRYSKEVSEKAASMGREELDFFCFDNIT